MWNALKKLMVPAQEQEIPIIDEIWRNEQQVRDLCKHMTESVKHSPDLGYLEQFDFQLLFVPDELKLGHKRYDMISDGAHICNAFTEKTFAFWMQETTLADGTIDRQGIPLRQDGNQIIRYLPPNLRIKGEVHAVRPYQFQQIDEYKRNTGSFRRQRVNLVVPYMKRTGDDKDDLGRDLPRALQGKGHQVDGIDRVYILRAWMYTAIPEYWNNLLDGGFRGFKTVNNYESRKKREWLLRYYEFPNPSI